MEQTGIAYSVSADSNVQKPLRSLAQAHDVQCQGECAKVRAEKKALVESRSGRSATTADDKQSSG